MTGLERLFIIFLNIFDFPVSNLPKIEIPDDFRKINDKTIETAANQTRECFNLGFGPITDVIRTLESNGIFVARANLDCEKLDALSEIDEYGQPYVFLNADKCSSVRSRFDAAHELGHMILHKDIDRESIRKPGDHSLMEKQAHHFAGAFLLPAREFNGELRTISLDCFRSLKAKWKLSIGAMISRCEQLELIDSSGAKRLWINRNRRGWREREPLDDSIPIEKPSLISQSFELLLSNNVKSKGQILNDLCLPAYETEELSSLPDNYFSSERADDILRPKFKNSSTGEKNSSTRENIIQITRGKKNSSTREGK